MNQPASSGGSITTFDRDDPAASTTPEQVSFAAPAIEPVELPPLPPEPLVSVIVTCRNYARFVGECLDSVLKQSYRHFEVIVVDDGSVDSSREIVATFARQDDRVRLIGKPHRGMAATLNSGWQASGGEIICLLDADDTFHELKLGAVVEGFRAHPRAGFLIHRAVRTDAGGQRRGMLPLMGTPPSGWCLSAVLENGGVLPNMPPTSNLAVRRRIADALFPLPERFVGFAERVIQRLAPLMTEVCWLDQVLATWRLHWANDANAAQMYEERIVRDLQVMEGLWVMQREYLEKVAPPLVGRLTPLQNSEYYCRQRYLWARMTRNLAAERFRLALVACPGFVQRPRAEQWFWRVADQLPAPVVETVGNWLVTQGRVKELIGLLLEPGRELLIGRGTRT